MESVDSELFGIEVFIEKVAENVDIVYSATKYKDISLVFGLRLRVVQQDFFFDDVLYFFDCVGLVC